MRKREKAEGRMRKAEGELPLWVQWVLAVIALALGGWFGWMMF